VFERAQAHEYSYIRQLTHASDTFFTLGYTLFSSRACYKGIYTITEMILYNTHLTMIIYQIRY
jgi:hypothetical protein